MKLFLASSLDKTLPLFEPLLVPATKEPSNLKVIFIANAADPYQEKWWIDLIEKNSMNSDMKSPKSIYGILHQRNFLKL